MTRLNTNIVAFNAGELSSMMDGRTDVDAYFRGCRTMKNVVPEIEGPASRRLGLRYIAPVRDESRKARGVPFIFNITQSYVLEFGHETIRFFQSQAQLLDGGAPYEIASPYQEDDLPLLRYRQRGDIMYLFHPNYYVRKLSRLGATNWTLEVVNFLFGPVIDENEDDTKKAFCSVIGTPGLLTNIQMTGGSVFQPGHVGSVWGFGDGSGGLGGYAEWQPSTNYGVPSPQYLRYNGNLYQTQGTGTVVTGTIPPTHKEGVVSDGVRDMLYWNSGTGFARMTAYINSNLATFEIQRSLPPTMQAVIGGTPPAGATKFWQEAAFSDVRGHPRAGEFFQQRLVLASTQESPLGVWASKTNRRLENFDRGAGEDDAALFFELDAEVNNVWWLRANASFILAGSFGGISSIGSGSLDAPLTPSNVRAKVELQIGSAPIEAIQTGNKIKYIQRNVNRMLEAEYDDIKINYLAANKTVRARQVYETGITGMVRQDEPDTVVHCPRGDGQLAQYFENGAEGVSAWARFVTGERSDGTFDAVEDVVVIPGVSQKSAEVWMIVRRLVAGQVRRYWELLEPDDTMALMDSYLKYNGAPVATVTGLDHLESETVQIIADGQIYPDQAVTDGAITLPDGDTASVIYAGLGYESILSPMTIEAGSRDGASQGEKKRVIELLLKLETTLGIEAGPSLDKMERVATHSGQMSLDAPMPKIGASASENVIIKLKGGYTREPSIILRQRLPAPMVIKSLTPLYSHHDR